MRALVTGFACLVLLLAACAPQTGQTPGDRLASPAELAAFSKQIERELAARGARAAIVFRAGRARDRLAGNRRYDHASLWVYGPIRMSDGSQHTGYAVYHLRPDPLLAGRTQAVQDWPYDFVRGDAVGQVGLIIPTPEIQMRLLELAASPDMWRLHQPVHSRLSNPLDLRYQGADEYLLDLISAAAWQRRDRTQIKTNLAHYYSPTRFEVAAWQRWLWSLFNADITFDDQHQPVLVADFDSIAQFMLTYRLAGDVRELQAPYYQPDRAGWERRLDEPASIQP
ncbi:DUF2145 domain-containing protein [Maricaulis sp. CAU 1757]